MDLGNIFYFLIPAKEYVNEYHLLLSIVIASVAKQSRGVRTILDCFATLTMTSLFGKQGEA